MKQKFVMLSMKNDHQSTQKKSSRISTDPHEIKTKEKNFTEYCEQKNFYSIELTYMSTILSIESTVTLHLSATVL